MERTTVCLIREARSSEAAALSDLALRSKAHWGYSPEFIESCRAELTITEEEILNLRMHTVLAEAGDWIVGFYRLIQKTGGTVELDSLFVEPQLMGQGIGRTLMEHARARAAALGAARLLIQSDPNADGFYVSSGGTFSGRSESASIPGRYLSTFTIDLRRAVQPARLKKEEVA